MYTSRSQNIQPVSKSLGHSRNISKMTNTSNTFALTATAPTRLYQKESSFHNIFEDSKLTRNSLNKKSESANRLKFYKDFKRINRLTERIEVNQLEITPNIAYLSNINQKKLIPNSFGLISPKAADSSIDIRMFSMGDNYAEAFSQGIKHISNLENLNLKANRLTDIGSEKILKSLDIKQIKRINLSENSLGELSVNKITNMFSFYDCKLKHLSLEKTKVSTQMVQSLCTSLLYYRRLSKLILAKNNLNDTSTRYLKEMLINNSSLKVLDLHWNNFSYIGGINLFDGLAHNKGVKVFDVSWNSIGKNRASAESISRCVKANTYLMHLDLSYNSITVDDTCIIAEGLKYNHSILGLHVLGNACVVDPRGFLKPSRAGTAPPCPSYERIIDRPDFINIKESINCWICEKWREVLFVCECEGENVYLHLEIDNYVPEAMPKERGNRFELCRVLPAGSTTFFFTDIDDYDLRNHYEKIPKEYEGNVVYQDGISKKVKVNFMGKIDTNKDIFEVCSMKNPFNTRPRTKEYRYLNMFGQMERVEWSIPISIFKDYKPDSERLIDECLEFDWRHSRVPNFVKNSEDQTSLRIAVRKHYAVIKQTYKNLSAYGGSDVFAIGSNVLTDFLNESKIIDSSYQLSDLGVNLNSTLLQKEKGQLYNPGNSLVRYEFIEILVRISADKYIRTKQLNTYTEAFNKLMNDYLSLSMSRFTSLKWRQEKFWVEEVDLVLKAHKQILNQLFSKYSGKHTLPGKKPFVSLEEFRLLCSDAGLAGEHFVTRDIDVCFSESMMTQVDDLYTKRHLEMSFVEMIEALSRAVDNCDNFQEAIGFTFQQISTTDLSKKLEVSFKTFINLCPAGFKEDYEFPTTEVYSKYMYRVKG